jgi:class 3 adenylate cyclase/CheY-like chemotaxis protein
MNILIVDDTGSQRFVLSAILKGAGYTAVQTTESAAAAFVVLALDSPDTTPAPPIDLILMDISMPEMDGLEACRRIKASTRLQDIPVIMVTASDATDDLQAAFDAGAMDYITKPPNKIELLARVRSALRLKQAIDDRKAREAELREVVTFLREEQAKSERLLLNILPRPVAERLKDGQHTIADSFADVTVLFADIVDFTQRSAQIPAGQLVQWLNDLFSRFDDLAVKHDLEKIKTIGDAYMVVGGLPTPRPDHAQAMAAMALDMVAAAEDHRANTGSQWALRIGLHTGPVVAGVIGQTKFIYDLWGDTVNLASRMEELCPTGRILVSATTRERLNGEFDFDAPQMMQVKGKGLLPAYRLIGYHQLS